MSHRGIGPAKVRNAIAIQVVSFRFAHGAPKSESNEEKPAQMKGKHLANQKNDCGEVLPTPIWAKNERQYRKEILSPWRTGISNREVWPFCVDETTITRDLTLALAFGNGTWVLR